MATAPTSGSTSRKVGEVVVVPEGHRACAFNCNLFALIVRITSSLTGLGISAASGWAVYQSNLLYTGSTIISGNGTTFVSSGAGQQVCRAPPATCELLGRCTSRHCRLARCRFSLAVLWISTPSPAGASGFSPSWCLGSLSVSSFASVGLCGLRNCIRTQC